MSQQQPMTIAVPEYPRPEEVGDKRDLPTGGPAGPGQDYNEFDVSGEGMLALDPVADSDLLQPPAAQFTGAQLRSLQNEGNVCYRNSVLHSLSSLDVFVKLLENGVDAVQKPIYSELLDLARRFRRGDKRLDNPANRAWAIIRYISAASSDPPFNTNQGDQEDAGEFLGHLMARLCGQELTVEEQSTIGVLYRRLFAHTIALRRVFNCACQQKLRIPLDPNAAASPFTFDIAKVSGEGDNSLAACISKAMYSQYPPEAASPPRCGVCNDQASRPIGDFKKLYYLPEVLPINIYYAQQDGQTDFDAKVDIPETLDLSMLCERAADTSRSTYKLQSAILYRGFLCAGSDSEDDEATTAGHYISYVRRGSGNDWFLLDDNDAALHSDDEERDNGAARVQKANFSDVQTHEGFQPRILFYVREGAAEAVRLHQEQLDAASFGQHALKKPGGPRTAPTSYGASSSFRVIDVGFKPTAYRPAVQTAHRRHNGNAGAGGTTNATNSTQQPPGNSNASGSEGPPNRTAAMMARSGGGAGQNDQGQDQSQGERGDEATARPPDGPAPQDLGNRANWDPKRVISEYLRAFGYSVTSNRNTRQGQLDLINQYWNRAPGTPVDWSLQSIGRIRAEIKRRGLTNRSSKKRQLTAILAAQDQQQQQAATPPPGSQRDNDQPGAGAAPEAPADSPADNPGTTPAAIGSTAGTAGVAGNAGGSPASNNPADPDGDPGVDTVITQVDQIFKNIKARECACDLDVHAALPADGRRNGRGTPNRALHVRLSAQGAAAGQTVGPLDYWIPLAPELDNQGLRIRAVVNVREPPQDSAIATVRVDLSGPEVLAAGIYDSLSEVGGLPFMNWIEFGVPFPVAADQVQVEMWQEDMLNIPLLDTRTSGPNVQTPPSDGGQRPGGNGPPPGNNGSGSGSGPSSNGGSQPPGGNGPPPGNNGSGSSPSSNGGSQPSGGNSGGSSLWGSSVGQPSRDNSGSDGDVEMTSADDLDSNAPGSNAPGSNAPGSNAPGSTTTQPRFKNSSSAPGSTNSQPRFKTSSSSSPSGGGGVQPTGNTPGTPVNTGNQIGRKSRSKPGGAPGGPVTPGGIDDSPTVMAKGNRAGTTVGNQDSSTKSESDVDMSMIPQYVPTPFVPFVPPPWVAPPHLQLEPIIHRNPTNGSDSMDVDELWQSFKSINAGSGGSTDSQVPAGSTGVKRTADSAGLDDVQGGRNTRARIGLPNAMDILTPTRPLVPGRDALAQYGRRARTTALGQYEPATSAQREARANLQAVFSSSGTSQDSYV